MADDKATEKAEDAITVTEDRDGGAVVRGVGDAPPRRDDGDDPDGDKDRQDGGDGDDPDGDEHRIEEPEGSLDDQSQKRERNRDKRIRQREMRRVAERTAKATIAGQAEYIRDLNGRLARLENNSVGQSMASLDTNIRQADGAIANAKAAHTAALTAGDHAAATEAADALSDAKTAKSRFEAIKAGAERRIKEAGNRQPANGEARERAEPVNPRAERLARSWQDKHDWYDPKDDDSDTQDDVAVLDALDDRLIAEGMDPSSKEYWTELDRRAAKRLPHRYGKTARAEDDDGDPRRRTPPQLNGSNAGDRGGGEGGISNRQQSPGRFKLSPARVEAIKDAGMWDEPEARNRLIRAYQKQDQEAATKR